VKEKNIYDSGKGGGGGRASGKNMCGAFCKLI